MIRKSSEEVVNGVDLVNAAGDSLEEIATHVAGITERIGVIAGVAKAQATSLHEVSSSVPQMDQNTRKNAAMVEENNRRHPPPRRRCPVVSDLVRQFRLTSAGNGPRAVAADALPAASPVRRMTASIGRAFARA